MFLFCNLELPQRLEIIPHESSETKPPNPGTGRRKVSESEETLRRHRVHIPRLVDAPVVGTSRVGKAWI